MKTIKGSLVLLLMLSVGVMNTQDSTANQKENEPIFEKAEKEAVFPGGLAEWRKYLEKNLKATTPIDNGAPVGLYTVIVRFIVNKDGNISDIQPLTKLGYGMEEEVVRIIQKSGAWSPAMMRGKPVKAYRKQPVTFVVMTDEYDISTATQYVLYKGIDNELKVDAGKVKPEDLQLTISSGSIVAGPNNTYIARVNKTGRVTVTLFNIKKEKEIGTVSFEVREK
jgi:hypothetical protein